VRWAGAAGRRRPDGGVEQRGQCCGALPSSRQQGMHTLVAVDVDAERRTRRRGALTGRRRRRVGRFLAVANEVDLLRQYRIRSGHRFASFSECPVVVMAR